MTLSPDLLTKDDRLSQDKGRYGGVIPDLMKGKKTAQQLNPRTASGEQLNRADQWTGPMPDHVNGVSVALFSLKF